MRILHIDTGREMRGGQHQVLLLLDGLRKRGWDSVLLARAGAPLWQAAKAAGHEVGAASAREIWSRSNTATVVHAHDARGHTLAAVASRKTFVVARRVAFPLKRSFLSRWKYSRAAAYLAVSRFVGDQLKCAGIPSSKIHVVHDGVEPRAPAEDWSPDYPVVALQSSDPGKLQHLAVEAAALAQVQLVLSSNLPDSLQRCSALVYLTSSEGLGSAALLAMSLGVPVIASKVGGLAEVFEDGTSGIYVQNDPQAIASALRTLLNNPELAARLKRGGLARVAERFSAERMVSETLRVYERVLA